MHVWEHSSTAFSGIRLVSSSKATVGLHGPAHALPERACVTLGRAMFISEYEDCEDRLPIVVFAWAAETLQEERRAPASLGAKEA
ncbi:hypothetical protein GGD67_002697 [Bradyrhizobium sp. IAR9]|nr:hypothetical protein [Bradyrhizobium sp. IAR9]